MTAGSAQNIDSQNCAGSNHRERVGCVSLNEGEEEGSRYKITATANCSTRNLAQYC